jgi:hypothetical protein
VAKRAIPVQGPLNEVFCAPVGWYGLKVLFQAGFIFFHYKVQIVFPRHLVRLVAKHRFTGMMDLLYNAFRRKGKKHISELLAVDVPGEVFYKVVCHFLFRRPDAARAFYFVGLNVAN